MTARRLLLVLFSALVLAVAMSVAGALASPRGAADQSWTDPAGDAQGGAPDITAVNVSHDTAGTITITVTAPLNDGGMLVFLDTNQNGTFNDSTDKVIGAWGFGPGVAVAVLIKSNPLMATVSATTTTVTFSFSKTEAGIATGFGFWVLSQSASQWLTDQRGDTIPDGSGALTYSLSAPPPPPTTTTAPPPAPAPAPAAAFKPVIGAPIATPLAAVAGRPMTVTFAVTRSDTHKPLTSGTMICDPSVAGKVIPHHESFKAGKARLSFVVPKTAKGKQLSVKVTIKTGTQSATRVATFRVR